jgi:hypothetical protein
MVRSEITSLEAKASKLTDFIRNVLCELYSKHALYLLNWCIGLYIHVAGNDLLYPFLIIGSSSLGNSITNTYIGGVNDVDNNLVIILWI